MLAEKLSSCLNPKSPRQPKDSSSKFELDPGQLIVFAGLRLNFWLGSVESCKSTDSRAWEKAMGPRCEIHASEALTLTLLVDDFTPRLSASPCPFYYSFLAKFLQYLRKG
ncbi:hypothetical protein FZEAL_6035 [Fusarium zealandicum]|uniref:Uncharacterized protein n=1 Tax=Fusarium zealandicum TaxID=1053134 RepID=A0A8H4UJQ1_9HYPO|nr:hypothetical protein FZEAL_6035 [Fusarium zealandicum]